MWDLSFLSRDQTHVPCIGRQILNHWTTREVSVIFNVDLFLMQILGFSGVRLQTGQQSWLGESEEI